MTKVITVRMSEDRVASIDALVASGAHPNRTSVIVERICLLGDGRMHEVCRALAVATGCG